MRCTISAPHFTGKFLAFRSLLYFQIAVWHVKRRHILSLYMSIIFPSLRMKAHIRALSSAFWAEVLGGKDCAALIL